MLTAGDLRASARALRVGRGYFPFSHCFRIIVKQSAQMSLLSLLIASRESAAKPSCKPTLYHWERASQVVLVDQ